MNPCLPKGKGKMAWQMKNKSKRQPLIPPTHILFNEGDMHDKEKNMTVINLLHLGKCTGLVESLTVKKKESNQTV